MAPAGCSVLHHPAGAVPFVDRCKPALHHATVVSEVMMMDDENRSSPMPMREYWLCGRCGVRTPPGDPLCVGCTQHARTDAALRASRDPVFVESLDPEGPAKRALEDAAEAANRQFGDDSLDDDLAAWEAVADALDPSGPGMAARLLGQCLAGRALHDLSCMAHRIGLAETAARLAQAEGRRWRRAAYWMHRLNSKNPKGIL